MNDYRMNWLPRPLGRTAYDLAAQVTDIATQTGRDITQESMLTLSMPQLEEIIATASPDAAQRQQRLLEYLRSKQATGLTIDLAAINSGSSEVFGQLTGSEPDDGLKALLAVARTYSGADFSRAIAQALSSLTYSVGAFDSLDDVVKLRSSMDELRANAPELQPGRPGTLAGPIQMQLNWLDQAIDSSIRELTFRDACQKFFATQGELNGPERKTAELELAKCVAAIDVNDGTGWQHRAIKGLKERLSDGGQRPTELVDLRSAVRLKDEELAQAIEDARERAAGRDHSRW